MSKLSIGEVGKIGAGFSIGCLAYLALNRLLGQLRSKPQTQNSPCPFIQQSKKQQQENLHELKNLAYMQQLLKNKSTSFELETLPDSDNILSKKCLKKFIEQTYDIFEAREIIEINQSSRRARRQVLDEINIKYETYFRFVCTLDQSIKYLLEKAQKDFAIFLNLDYERITESINYHLESKQQSEQSADMFRLQIVESISSVRESLANYMPLYKSPVSKAELLSIMAYQTQLLSQERDMLTALISKMGLTLDEEQQALPVFVTCYVEDMTWRQFGVESEQMSLQAEDLDEEFRRAHEEFKAVRDSVIRDMHEAIQADIIFQQ